MTKRQIRNGLIVLAAAGAAALLLVFVLKPGAGGEEEEIASDVAVHVGHITRATLRRYVTAYGTVEPEPAGGGRPAAGADLCSPVSGILCEIRCAEGDHAERGAVLFRLDTRLAEVAVAKAEKVLLFAEQAYERQKKLFAAEATSQREYQEAESQLNAARNDLATAKTELSLLEVKAPLAGTVVRISARLGQAVEPNAVLAQVIDLDRLVVTARVPSGEAGLLKTGQAVESGPGNSPAGRLTVVGLDVDPGSDTVLVRASLPAAAGYRPGQFLSLRIVCEERVGVLAVPEESIVNQPGGGEAVILVEGDRAVPKPVSTGLRDGGLAEITGDGLREGLVIVTTDAYNVPGETKVHVIGDQKPS